jgi:hypothetical protein
VTGGETDTFSRKPSPTTLHIDTVDANGNVTPLTQTSLPTTTIDLPDQDPNTIAIVRATGLDANGTVLVYGESLPVQLGGLQDLTLDIFVQRTGELARLPSPFTTAPAAPVLGTVYGRYLVAAGGSDPSQATLPQIYDVLNWSAVSSPPTFPRAPLSMAVVGTTALLIDTMGATWYDLSDSTATAVQAPSSGASFGDIAGGVSVTAPDGVVFVVGGTRTAAPPTAAVLRVGTDQTLTWVALSTPRAGAATTWAPGRGLVVAGGSASGPGAEILGETDSVSTAVPYPSDSSSGAGATALDSTHLLVAGGLVGSGASAANAGSRVLDLGCSQSCVPVAWQAPTVSLAYAQPFTLDANTALIIGSEPMGATHAYVTTATSAGELTFKVPRSNARAIGLGTGAVVVVGGDVTIESFFP